MPRKADKRRRVGKLAHGPLRSRCPRAAPNPFLGDYAPVLKPTMGQQSHSTGYLGSSTKGPLFNRLDATSINTKSCNCNRMHLKRRADSLRAFTNSTTPRPPPFQLISRSSFPRYVWLDEHLQLFAGIRSLLLQGFGGTGSPVTQPIGHNNPMAVGKYFCRGLFGCRVRYNSYRRSSVMFASQTVVSRRRSSGVFHGIIQPVQNSVFRACRARRNVHGQFIGAGSKSTQSACGSQGRSMPE